MSETVQQARDRFLAAYGLDVTTYTTPGFAIHLGRWTLQTPNPGLLPYHDLHHVATGFPSGLIGEAEISAFELRVGCGSAFIGFLCVGAICLGLCLSPRRVCRAWTKSRGAKSLYHTKIEYETLLAMRVDELREYLHLPMEGLG